MSGRELIEQLGLKHLTVKDVEQVEEAMNTMDEETVLAVVDELVGNSKQPKKTKKAS